MTTNDWPSRASGTRDLGEHYARLLAEQAGSGLTMQQFAARHGVTACTLYFWRRRLASASTTSSARSLRGSGLVAVNVLGRSGARDESPGYEVCLPNGVCVRVPTGFDSSRVAELLEVARSC